MNTAKIRDIGIHGEGIGDWEGLTVFIPGALPGETVAFSPKVKKTKYATGTLKTVIEPSADRREPLCDLFGRCGGCQLQHLADPAQAAWKTNHVKAALERIGGFEAPVVHPILTGSPWHYRNKAQIPVYSTGMGFFAANSHSVVDMTTCPIQNDTINTTWKAVRRAIIDHAIPVYDEATHKGVLRHVIIRVSLSSGAVMVGFVGLSPTPPKAVTLAAKQVAKQGVTSVIYNHNPAKGNTILGPSNRVLVGSHTLSDELLGIAYQFDLHSFVQVNTPQTEVLYQTVLKAAALSGTETVWDVYSGIGILTLLLAKNAKQVTGIESISQTVENAKANAALNGVTTVDFQAGAAENLLPELPGTVDVIVVDPPRKGCEAPVLEAIGRSTAHTLVYVSCDPGTLARDLKQLRTHGFVLEWVQPIDLFAQTIHVESVCKLSRPKPI